MKKTLMMAALIGFGAMGTLASAAEPTHQDTSFMKSAAEAGYTEVQASKMALDKSSNQQVKDFATMMVTDHTKAGDELSALASSKGVTLPTDPSLVQKTKIKALSLRKDTGFDKMYASDIGVSAHKSTVALFQKEVDKGTDPDVKAFAQKTLPTLQHHLDAATTLAASTKTAAKDTK